MTPYRDREEIRWQKYKAEAERLDKELESVDKVRRAWEWRAYEAEAELARLKDEHPIRAAIVRALEALTDRLR